MAVIGGVGSPVGAVLGAIYLTAAPELFRSFKDAQMVIYGLTLVMVMRFMPNGLAGISSQLSRLIKILGRRPKTKTDVLDVEAEHQA
jgi:branched-chain amino acid transport system permease protein